ncbi:MAG: shikimate dehydrogenase [candidate division Zixibacteria bacterium]|nr:shikimate dehydrogenase [candidate division Zixibacteria bacterium]
MITNYKFGLIGENVIYSKSPAIFSVIFEMEQINGVFDIINVEPELLRSKLKSLTALGYQGVSVTVPYKEMIIEYIDELDARAKHIGAVNSLLMSDMTISGYNTDCDGFALPLRKYQKILKDGIVLLLGCGGSARAVAYSLNSEFGVKKIYVASRDEKHLSDFKSQMETVLPDVSIETMDINKLDKVAKQTLALIVNCTPLGGPNHAKKSPLPYQFEWPQSEIYYDLNYNLDNCALTLSRETSKVIIDGTRMLVGQAVKSYQLWTGRKVPFETVYEQIDFGGA